MFATLCWLGIVVSQSAAADDALGAEVRRLVRQLDAPQLAQRDAAEAGLLKLGPGALDLLPAIDDRTPAEIAQRLGRVRHKLQQAMAQAATQTARVTLQGDGMPLSQVLAAIQEQTGNKIVDSRARTGEPGLDRELKVDFRQTPFWQALDQVLDQAELTLYPFPEEKAIHLVPRPESHLPRAGRACYAGPFRLEPVRVSAERDLRNPVNKALGVTVEITWEPRLGPISLQQRMADVVAVDDAGNPLPVGSEEAELEIPVEPEAVAKEVRIPLGLPPRQVRKIARLAGTFSALVPGKVQTFRFRDLEKANEVAERVAGVTVTLEGARRNNQVWEVRVRVRFDEASGALQSHRGWIFENEAFLEDPEGRPVVPGAFETTRQTNNEVGVAYLFRPQRPLADYTFVYKTAAAILSTEFRYEMRDIPLP